MSLLSSLFRFRATLALCLLPVHGVSQEAQDSSGTSPASAAAAPHPGDGFLVGGGAVRFGLVLPREEELVYNARVSLGILDLAAGDVEQSCRVEPYRRSVFASALEDGGGSEEAATIRIHAEGEHSFYRLDSTIEARHLPQAWPRIISRNVSHGNEERKRESLIGSRGGRYVLSYRRDTSKGAPKGSRIWREPVEVEVPEDTVDMLTAVFLCRVLIRDGLEELSFPLANKARVWNLTLRRGRRERVKTPAGTFDAVEIILAPELEREDDGEPVSTEKFRGLFGLHGSIHLWVEVHTGIAVRISGDLPAGPVTLGIDVRLKTYSGVAEGFRTVR